MTSVLFRLLLLFHLYATVVAQEIMSAWNQESPPSCAGLNVTLTFTKNFGANDYEFSVIWGDDSLVEIDNRTVEDGETLSFTHAYASAGTFQILARALVPSFQTEIGYADVVTIDDSSCSFDRFQPTVSPRPTRSPTEAPTFIVPTVAPTPSPAAPSVGGGGVGAPTPVITTASPTPAPTPTPATFADFVATSNRVNPADSSQHYIVRITDPETIGLARAEIGKQTDYLTVTGTIVVDDASWNPNWSFYVRPITVTLGGIFPATCDVTASYIQFNLGEAGESYLPNLLWCPSNSRILREVQTSSGGGGGGGSSPSDSPPDDSSGGSSGGGADSDGSNNQNSGQSSEFTGMRLLLGMTLAIHAYLVV